MITTPSPDHTRPRSVLLLPPRPLAGCLFAGIVRDTRGAGLGAADRLNHFPASPLVSVTCVLAGRLHLLSKGIPGPGLPPLSVLPPQPGPVTSTSPGDIHVLSIGLYPDAWHRLTAGSGVLPPALGAGVAAFAAQDDPHQGWAAFCAALLPAWQAVRAGPAPAWSGIPLLADWSRALITRAALAGPGRSLRATQRRLKRWSGQTLQSLDFYAGFENLHRHAVHAEGTPLAELAVLAGYADQSHMGRAVRRATGFSPARLNHQIKTHEPFWCYRLLGTRF